MKEKLFGKTIKTTLRTIAEDLAGHGIATAYKESHRGVPYTAVYIGKDRYHITFFGKHQFFRVFKATDPANPHVDFDRDDEEGLFQYILERSDHANQTTKAQAYWSNQS